MPGWGDAVGSPPALRSNLFGRSSLGPLHLASLKLTDRYSSSLQAFCGSRLQRWGFLGPRLPPSEDARYIAFWGAHRRYNSPAAHESPESRSEEHRSDL